MKKDNPILDAFSDFKETKNIDRATMMNVMIDVFKTALKNKYNSKDTDIYNVIANVDKGILTIYRDLIVVADEDYEDPATQITLTDVQKREGVGSFDVGEIYAEKIDIKSFGRRMILALRQNLQSRILELEKENVYIKYKEKIGEVVTVEVDQTWKREIVAVDEEGTELILPREEQIKGDKYKKGDPLKAIVTSVEKNGSSLRIMLSRTAPRFLAKLFENEVPEIFDGLITVKGVARIPGDKAKIAVESYDDRIDPVGACVGIKGSRIHGIVRELRNENIDVINYTTNQQLYIQRALAPAKINNIQVFEQERKAEVYLPQKEVSLAIGRAGSNIKLAIMLTGYNIEVYRELEDAIEDVELEEFSLSNDPESGIEDWIIQELKRIGCDTAKSVLELSIEDLIQRTDLEEEMIIEVRRILAEEFE